MKVLVVDVIVYDQPWAVRRNADNEPQFPSLRMTKAQGTVFCNRYFDTPSQLMICIATSYVKKNAMVSLTSPVKSVYLGLFVETVT